MIRYRLSIFVAAASAAFLSACGPQPQVVYQQPAQPQVVYQQQQPQVVYQQQPQVIYAQPQYNNGYMDVAAGAILTAAMISALSPNQYTMRGGQYYSTTVIHNHVDRSTYDRISTQNRAQIADQQRTINQQNRQLAATRAQQQTQSVQRAAPPTVTARRADAPRPMQAAPAPTRSAPPMFASKSSRRR